ncbi:MAG: aryl-sulfate sulfotransferase, partial [Gammaproteobacteria bacterium]
MTKYYWLISVVGLSALSAPTTAYEAFQGPTELIQYDPARAYEGYTLFTPALGRNAYLIDMHGRVVNMWQTPESWWDHEIREHSRLLEDGSLLRSATVGDGSTPGTYQLVDWDSKVIWEYQDSREGYSGHHDLRMIWNPKLGQRTLLYTSTRAISHEAALALGVDPALRESYESRPDGLVEVDMEGNVIWEWNISDHVVQDRFPDSPTYGVISEHPGRLDPNFGTGVTGNWIHINGFDYNQELDHIVVNNSRFSEFYVIDHGGTFVPGDPERSIDLAAGDDGDFIYRWGNACVYDSGDCPSMTNEGLSTSNGHQQVFFSHDIQWISDREVRPYDGEIPGDGNLLIFNNGARQPGPSFSSVIELNP